MKRKYFRMLAFALSGAMLFSQLQNSAGMVYAAQEILGGAEDQEVQTVVSWDWEKKDNLVFQKGENGEAGVWKLLIQDDEITETILNQVLPNAIIAKVIRGTLQSPSDAEEATDSNARKRPSKAVQTDSNALEEVRIGVTWELEEHFAKTKTVSLKEEELKLKAVLEDGYVLASGVPEVQVEAVLWKGTPAAADDLKKYTVEGVRTPGTVVNMFDYWLGENRYNNEENYSDNRHTRQLGTNVHKYGINKNKTLLFSNGTGNGRDENGYNYWNSEKPETPFSYREGKALVTNILPEDGYPAIRLDWGNEEKK